jgi:hypothetical protein
MLFEGNLCGKDIYYVIITIEDQILPKPVLNSIKREKSYTFMTTL